MRARRYTVARSGAPPWPGTSAGRSPPANRRKFASAGRFSSVAGRSPPAATFFTSRRARVTGRWRWPSRPHRVPRLAPLPRPPTPIAIAVDTDRQVLTGINELESAWRSYANAARYMLEVKKDFDAGLKYVDQSLALKDDWYTRWIKASLLAAKGDWPGARGEGEKAYQLGQKLGETFTLENELRQNLAEWSRRADGVAAKGGKRRV